MGGQRGETTPIAREADVHATAGGVVVGGEGVVCWVEVEIKDATGKRIAFDDVEVGAYGFGFGWVEAAKVDVVVGAVPVGATTDVDGPDTVPRVMSKRLPLTPGVSGALCHQPTQSERGTLGAVGSSARVAVGTQPEVESPPETQDHVPTDGPTMTTRPGLSLPPMQGLPGCWAQAKA